MPSAKDASRAFPEGTIMFLMPFSAAPKARDKMPLISFISPARESSPKKAKSSRVLCGSFLSATKRAKAMARSKPLPSFFMSAGARFTIIFCGGREKPLFLSAARTLSLASFIAASGRPTMSKAGRPAARSASMVTVNASIPIRAKLLDLDIIVITP